MIRHLHDLYALRDYVCSKNKDFKVMVHTSFVADEDKPSRSVGMTLPKAIEQMLKNLNEDKMYKEEYESFVLGMSYAKSQDLASFNEAIKILSMLSEKF